MVEIGYAADFFGWASASSQAGSNGLPFLAARSAIFWAYSVSPVYSVRGKTPAPQRFTQQAVLVWAVPQQVKGIQRAVTQIKAPKHRENKEKGQWDWRNAAADADVARANKHARAVAEDKPGEMIVLADSNYDMTNWDSQGLTERTYQRWNKAIKDGLESLVNEALVEAQHMLEAVGVLESEAA
ncbi:hypothetical protein [Pseudomonas sp. MF6776]|uniref:hypothetical protein n=1 Tax=Pseudomonas sp. MF6776 TaxID=2797534 RepID=UPI002D80B1C1|nr:hypothetical protein [Pseudomonas sp. MF6776]